jgi:hypothetical protein
VTATGSRKKPRGQREDDEKEETTEEAEELAPGQKTGWETRMEEEAELGREREEMGDLPPSR